MVGWKQLQSFLDEAQTAQGLREEAQGALLGGLAPLPPKIMSIGFWLRFYVRQPAALVILLVV